MELLKRNNTDFHDNVVKQIATIRFPFPNGEHPNWKTYTNHPEKTLEVTDNKGNAYYPDIVVVDTTFNAAVFLGEIETPETVSEQEVLQWAQYSKLGKLYLYVPEGYSSTAQNLARNINIAGFRYFRVVNGLLQVVNC